ncbi:hypothetical protein KKB44_04605 [Candidatus Micrarchaeota archaeon]|nr:hypothetical protein [Candidatus Micrarchaeota archaeon]
MRIFIALIALILLFGCIDGEPEVQNQTNITNVTEQQPPVTIIIGQQENQTVEGNYTEIEPEENDTLENTFEYSPNKTLGIYFIDVGDQMLHGDAILIKKGDLDILVDAGPQEKGNDVVDFLNSRSVDDIELLISTNADPRHYGGIKTVANNFEIGEVWWTGDTFANTAYADAINKTGAKIEKVWDGHTAELNGITLEILNPSETERFGDVNNDAIVTRITDRNFSLLLTSGIQTGAQGDLINNHLNEIKNQVIHAPYYGVGAGTSNIGILLIKAEPEVMIISGSADESAVNGGSREPFKRLMEQYGIIWYENYVNGTIKVTVTGEGYSVQPVES